MSSKTSKKHWRDRVDCSIRFELACSRIAWLQSAKHGGPHWVECGASVFVDLAAADPDWYCVTCAKAARNTVAKSSAPKPEHCTADGPRTDSDRYAELRKLVEEWKDHVTGPTGPPVYHDTDWALIEWSHR